MGYGICNFSNKILKTIYFIHLLSVTKIDNVFCLPFKILFSVYVFSVTKIKNDFWLLLFQDALVGLCAENRRTFDQNELTEQDIKDIYKDILESAEQQCSQYKRNEEIIVPSPLMKKYISKYIRESKVKAAWIKKEMASHGYLAERNGVYCWSHTINGESLSGYQLFIKKED